MYDDGFQFQQNLDESHPRYGFATYPDPFAAKPRTVGTSFIHGLLATALFRCWHILLFFAAWSTAVSVINHNGHQLYMQPTLLTVYVPRICILDKILTVTFKCRYGSWVSVISNLLQRSTCSVVMKVN
jgi:hypothetical protein